MRVYYISILLFISSIITTDSNEMNKINEYKHIERVKQLETRIKTMRDNVSTIKPSMTHKKKTNILLNIQQKIKSGISAGTSGTSNTSGISGTSSTSSSSGTSSTSNISGTPSRILRTGSVSGTDSMGSTPDMSNILRIPCIPDMSNMVYKPYPRTPSIPNIPSMEIPYKECITNTPDTPDISVYEYNGCTPDMPVYKEYEYNGCTPYKHIIPNSTPSIGSAPDKPRRHNSIPNISNTLSIPHTPAISSMSNAVSTPNMSNTPNTSDGMSSTPPVPRRNINKSNTPPVPAPRRDINKSDKSNTPNKSNTSDTSNTSGMSDGVSNTPSVPVPRHSLNKPINPLLDPVTCTQNMPPTKNIEYLMVDTCFECINVLEIYLLYLNIQVKDLPSIRKDLLRIIESARE
ncbi:hypothetical protein NEIG_02329 [Nematocida sp. ERTm5]|nr:hypothetical protein NEIG_02329 [Nematocida sp. ERTm5]